MISFGESSFDDIFKPPGLAVTSPAMPGSSHWSKKFSIIVLGLNSAYYRLTFGDSLFYCYFERVASRKLWFFFIRMLDSKEQSKKFKAIIMIGHSALERGDYQKAGIRFTGPVIHYRMGKREVREKGLSLAVSDEYLKSCKVDNVLFRIWFQVTEQSD